MPNGLSYFKFLDRFFPRLILLSPYFTDIPVFNANSIDPDQTPPSDLGLYVLLLMFLLWDAKHGLMGYLCKMT